MTSEAGQEQEQASSTGPQFQLVVTTRSRLRSVRHFPAMLLATANIKGQLDETEGIVRWASIVVRPTEFWTVTVWRSRDAMQAFMRSDAHGDFMWRVGRWLDSFWLMRWAPGEREIGNWKGLSVAWAGDEGETTVMADTSTTELLDAALVNIPSLREVIGADGVASYAATPAVRDQRRLVEGAGGVIVRIKAPIHRLLPAVIQLRKLRRRLRLEDDLLGVSMGMGRFGELFLLSVWKDRDGVERLFQGDWPRSTAERWPGRFWASEWCPENEFGHWDGKRLRRRRSGLATRQSGSTPERSAVEAAS